MSEFTNKIYGIIRDKIFISLISSEPAEVVDKLPKDIVPGKVLFDGMMLYDGIKGIEDDIQQMNSVTKDGKYVNLEDYYTDNGAFDDDGWDRFIAALNRLMTLDEFLQYIRDDGEGLEPVFDEDELCDQFEDANNPLYPIDENGHSEVPEGTTYIDDMAYKDCPGLVSVKIPDSVNWIGPGAFYGCTNLTSIKASGVRIIDLVAFMGCTNLSSVEITSPEVEICGRAFKDCSSLKDVVLPKKTMIYDDTFEGCPCKEEVMKKTK